MDANNLLTNMATNTSHGFALIFAEKTFFFVSVFNPRRALYGIWI